MQGKHHGKKNNEVEGVKKHLEATKKVIARNYEKRNSLRFSLGARQISLLVPTKITKNTKDLVFSLCALWLCGKIIWFRDFF